MDQAVTLLNSDFSVRQIGFDLDNLTLKDEGRILFAGYTYSFTDWTFESLCRILRLPAAFARSIPFDLLVENIDRLKIDHNQRVIALISRDILINVVPHPYVAARSTDLLNRLTSIQASQGFERLEARLSDRGMVLNFLSDGFTAEPVPGDITRIGLSILNSETGYHGAKSSFYLHRLVCSNGATLSNSWGSVGWSYDSRLSYERSLSNFIDGIEQIKIDFERFDGSYARLINREIHAFEFINTWRRLGRMVGTEDADRISGVDKDKRNEWSREVREGDRRQLTGIPAYQLYNNITQAARRYTFVQRRALEGLGGSIVDLVRSEN